MTKLVLTGFFSSHSVMLIVTARSYIVIEYSDNFHLKILNLCSFSHLYILVTIRWDGNLRF